MAIRCGNSTLANLVSELNASGQFTGTVSEDLFPSSGISTVVGYAQSVTNPYYGCGSDSEDNYTFLRICDAGGVSYSDEANENSSLFKENMHVHPSPPGYWIEVPQCACYKLL